jgi:hypothetical protein
MGNSIVYNTFVGLNWRKKKGLMENGTLRVGGGGDICLLKSLALEFLLSRKKKLKFDATQQSTQIWGL